MQNWNRLDQLIFSVESKLDNGLFKHKKPSENDEMPEEEVFNSAQTSFYKKEYKKLQGYRTPRPLTKGKEGLLCSRCNNYLVYPADNPEMTGEYCKYCGQRFLYEKVSKAALEYANQHTELMAES